jgi:hypothetical protein
MIGASLSGSNNDIGKRSGDHTPPNAFDTECRMTALTKIRFVAAAIVIAWVVLSAGAASAQQPNSVSPNADAVQEQQLLQEFRRIQGRGSLPDIKSDVINNPPVVNGRSSTRSICGGLVEPRSSASFAYLRVFFSGAEDCASANARGIQCYVSMRSSASCTG